MVVVVIESWQQGTSLPLAMAVVLSWNQIDHNKSFFVSLTSMSMTPLHILNFALILERLLTYASTSQDPPEGVPPL
jgi:hypothetical protein